MSTRPQFSANPALLSPTLRSLFPAGVAAAELRTPADPQQLFAEEAQYLGRAVQKRRPEFTAGRLCARRVLAEFGVVEFPLRVAADRQPVWPPRIVGSITHTDGYCAAVAGEKSRLAGLGVDSEVVGHVTPDIWATICAPREAAWVHSLPAAEQPAAVTLLFCAKEAFYKCQYPLVGEWLDFHDLHIEPRGWGASSSEFAVHANRRLAVAGLAGFPLTGRYLFHESYITAGVAIERNHPGL